MTKADRALKSWRSLVAALPSLTEAEVAYAIRSELEGRRRKTVLSRLASRATRLEELKAQTHYRKVTSHE